MSECICPKCGYVWNFDGVPPSSLMKRAIADHIAGKADSVVSAAQVILNTSLRTRMLRIQQYCDLKDLQRFRSNVLMPKSKIFVGGIYCWEPDTWEFGAVNVVEVTKIEHRPNGDVFVWTKSPGEQQEFYNDFSRCQEAFVLSNLKLLPPEL